MTENLLQKLEEKMMLLLSEIEDSRKEIQRLHQDVQRVNQENSTLKFERESHARKLQDLISLLDAVNGTETMVTNTVHLKAVDSVSVQG